MANKYREIEKNDIEEAVIEKVAAQTSPASRPSKSRKKGVLAKGLSSVFSGTFLSSDRALRHLPFLLFLGLIAVFYIANGYYADDMIRKENRLKQENKEKRSEYISVTSELMFASKQSEVAKAAESIGLKEPIVPPTKIEVDSAQLFKDKNSGK
ncbi:MAG: hypothetical protein H0W61_13710 [Bacteroidetes bacterium]|nr:hypothetical protein [Bacteroidota bacterium]